MLLLLFDDPKFQTHLPFLYSLYAVIILLNADIFHIIYYTNRLEMTNYNFTNAETYRFIPQFIEMSSIGRMCHITLANWWTADLIAGWWTSNHSDCDCLVPKKSLLQQIYKTYRYASNPPYMTTYFVIMNFLCFSFRWRSIAR